MSHNTALGSPPHVTAFTSVIDAAGATTVTITGGRLSTSCRLEIPAALGTVTGPGVYTATSSTVGELAFPVTALAPPGSPATRVCTLSNGGHVSTGTPINIAHQDWSPSRLITSVDDGWFRASELSAVGDGNNVSAWDPSIAPAITSILPGFAQLTSTDQPFYTASFAGLNGKPAVVFGHEDVAGTIGNEDAEMWASAGGTDGWDQRGDQNAGSMAMAYSPTLYGIGISQTRMTLMRGSSTHASGRSNRLSGITGTGAVYTQNNNYTGISSTGHSNGTGLHVLVLTWPGDTVSPTVSLYVNSDTPVATGTAESTKVLTGKGLIYNDTGAGALGEVLFLHGTQMSDADVVALRAYWRGIYE